MADDNDKGKVPTKSSGAKSTTPPDKQWVTPSPDDLAAMKSVKSSATTPNTPQLSIHRKAPPQDSSSSTSTPSQGPAPSTTPPPQGSAPSISQGIKPLTPEEYERDIGRLDELIKSMSGSPPPKKVVPSTSQESAPSTSQELKPLTLKEFEVKKRYYDILIKDISEKIDSHELMITILDKDIKKLGPTSILDSRRQSNEQQLSNLRGELIDMYREFFGAKHNMEELEKRNPANTQQPAKVQGEPVSSIDSLKNAIRGDRKAYFFQPDDTGHASVKEELQKLAKAEQKSNLASETGSKSPTATGSRSPVITPKDDSGPKFGGSGT
jgi:hypothetical protein